MRTTILAKLDELSSDENLIILYACESGSRGWEFASADSDYDIRFIYLRRPETYLAIHPVRDVIELPITDELDIVGWDFRKTLQLFQRSNPRLLEWMSSPIVYVETHDVITRLWRLVPDYFSPFTCATHYYRAACHYFPLAIVNERMHVKKIFYALRTLLAVNWLEKTNTPLPMSIWTSTDRVVTSAALRQAIEELYLAKQHMSEQAEIPIIPALQEYCAHEITRLAPIVPALEQCMGEDGPLNELFRDAFYQRMKYDSSHSGSLSAIPRRSPNA